MADEQEQPQQFQVPLSWIGADEVPILFVNQFLGLVDDRGDAIISFGQANPPAALGSPEEIRKQFERLAYVPVRPMARLSLTRERMLQLIGVLNQTIQNQDQVRQVIAQERG